MYRALQSLKLYLISVHNLIVEVDAKYIKGMLSNLHIAPSASINHWILSILMFHFTLVHVPGLHHGPDGLLRRKPQVGDEEEPEDDFDDWIDNVNGFMHIINPSPTIVPALTATPPIINYAITSDHNQTKEDNSDLSVMEEAITPYSVIPRSEIAIAADQRLEKVRDWLETLKRPDGMIDPNYKTFMCYCTEFFVSDKHLWRKDSKGQHKIVVYQDRRLFLINAAHNDAGHHGFYATNALLTERYWWPNLSQDIAWFVLTCRVCQLQKT